MGDGRLTRNAHLASVVSGVIPNELLDFQGTVFQPLVALVLVARRGNRVGEQDGLSLHPNQGAVVYM